LTIETQVLIVGAGPAGIIMTAELLRRGISVRVIDKLPCAQGFSKALTVHSRTLEMFERIDPGLLARFLKRGLPVKGFSFKFQGIEEEPVLDFQNLDTDYPYVLNHRQDETELYIREYIQNKFGHEIEWNTELVEMEQEKEGIRAKLVHHDEQGRQELIHCQWLIACDGIHSHIRETLGLDYGGEDYTGMVLQNMDVDLAGFPAERRDWLNFFMTKDRFILMTPLPGGFFRLLLSDMGAAADPNISPKEAFQSFVTEHLPEVTLGEPVWASKWEIWNRLASDYREGNIFLVGDSAHVHSPSGGQGMNCCMQDAHNLAWKLALVIDGKAAPSLLDSYEAERMPIAEQVIHGASAIHQIIMGHGVEMENRFELADNPEWLEQAVGRLSGISHSYRLTVSMPSDLSPSNGPQAGERAPNVRLAEDSTLFSLFSHPNFTLLLIPSQDNNGEIALCRELSKKLASTYKTLLHHHLLASLDLSEGTAITEQGIDNLRSAYELSNQGQLLLVRPDGYIGFRCLLSEREHLSTFLGTLFTN